MSEDLTIVSDQFSVDFNFRDPEKDACKAVRCPVTFAVPYPSTVTPRVAIWFTSINMHCVNSPSFEVYADNISNYGFEAVCSGRATDTIKLAYIAAPASPDIDVCTVRVSTEGTSLYNALNASNHFVEVPLLAPPGLRLPALERHLFVAIAGAGFITTADNSPSYRDLVLGAGFSVSNGRLVLTKPEGCQLTHAEAVVVAWHGAPEVSVASECVAADVHGSVLQKWVIGGASRTLSVKTPRVVDATAGIRAFVTNNSNWRIGLDTRTEGVIRVTTAGKTKVHALQLSLAVVPRVALAAPPAKHVDTQWPPAFED